MGNQGGTRYRIANDEEDIELMERLPRLILLIAQVFETVFRRITHWCLAENQRRER